MKANELQHRISQVENSYVWDAFVLCHAYRSVHAYQKIEGGGLKGRCSLFGSFSP